MVFFTCGSCGSSLKKNQVEKHYKFQCKSCKYVSCMDCSKDFWGNTYETHLKCITEDQKYGGSNFVAKEFKGEKKQEAWTAKVQAVVATTKNMDPQLKTLLNQIIGFDNIPRKKSKFENFLKNSAKIRNPDLVARAWKVFESATKENSNKNCNGDAATQNGTVGDTKESNEVAEKKEDGVTEEHEAPKEKLSKEEKRKRKEEKKLKKLERKAEEEAKSQETVEPGEVETDVKKIKKEKKKKKEEDKQNGDKPEVADQGEPEDESVRLENKKKRKVEEVESEEVVEKGDVKTEMKKNKKKKKKQQNDEEPEAKEMGNSDEPKTETEVKKKKKDKRKQKPEGLVNDDVPETADLEVNQELTKEQKKEERRKEKLARKEERRRVERENVASEETPVLNGRSKKKRKHEEKDRDDTDEQLPKKKKKKVCEDMNGAVEEPVNSEEHVCNGINDSKIVEEEVNNSESSVSPFKWKVVIRQALSSAPGKRLKITKLRKKVLAEYHSASGGSGDSLVSQSELYALFGQKIKSGKFVIDKEYVQMRC
ncbi:uncharacterized protein LOC143025364 [Oratosquilla oratoria]|uniref:uncharacterized protein LOC143025364 n=1 Tax=Oratosquilla oratoria TaxID=337810 RepID=UPI003F764DAE